MQVLRLARDSKPEKKMDTYIVAGYQGNLYVRVVSENDTTVYSDEELFSSSSEEEAIAFCNGFEESYRENWENQG